MNLICTSGAIEIWAILGKENFVVSTTNFGLETKNFGGHDPVIPNFIEPGGQPIFKKVHERGDAFGASIVG